MVVWDERRAHSEVTGVSKGEQFLTGIPMLEGSRNEEILSHTEEAGFLLTELHNG